MAKFMGFSLTSPAPEKSDPTAKTRVWGFFGEAPEMSRQNRLQSLQPRQEIRLNATKVASGRAYWPSRDPIEERGGINLYGMVGNDAVGKWDYLGLTETACKCITLADRPVGSASFALPVKHYALHKWEVCPKDKGKQVTISIWKQEHEDSKSLDKLELLNTAGFTAMHLKIKWKRRPVGISVINYGHLGTVSEEMANVYDETDGDVDKKWREILAAARKYSYAEQGNNGVVPATLANFPASVYRPTENNSNTFVREMMAQTSIPARELRGSHPGKMKASPSGTDSWYKDPMPAQ